MVLDQKTRSIRKGLWLEVCTPGCFAERVRKMLRKLEIVILAMQKSA